LDLHGRGAVDHFDQQQCQNGAEQREREREPCTQAARGKTMEERTGMRHEKPERIDGPSVPCRYWSDARRQLVSDRKSSTNPGQLPDLRKNCCNTAFPEYNQAYDASTGGGG